MPISRTVLSWLLLFQLTVAIRTSVHAQACPECTNYELSSVVELPIPPSDDVYGSNPTCAPAVRSQIAQVESALSGAAIPDGDYAALNTRLRERAQAEALLSQAQKSEAKCQNFFIALPAGSVVTRVVLSARDYGTQGSICADDREPVRNHPSWRQCGIGWSGFEGPVIQQLNNAILVYGTFLNWSHDRTRQAALQVDYRPPKDFLPQANLALPVEVFYATSRNSVNGTTFGANRGQRISLGKCVVTIPPGHRKGQLESPSWWRLEFSNDPARDVILQSVTPLSNDEFYSIVRSASNAKEALVFIHGFDTTFADAVRRTAQIKYDLGFQGAAVSFTWPSQGSPSRGAYSVDETNAEWTVPLLADFLHSLAMQLGNTKIVLISHSMGSRILMNALIRLKGQSGIPANFSKIVLAAPDIDRDVFVDQVRQGKQPMTVYASSRDQALLVSRGIHGTPRAGDTAAGVTTADGVDTIDVSNIDSSLIGHSYFGDNRSIISDIYYLIRDLPMPRFGLQKAMFQGHQYWLFQP